VLYSRNSVNKTLKFSQLNVHSKNGMNTSPNNCLHESKGRSMQINPNVTTSGVVRPEACRPLIREANSQSDYTSFSETDPQNRAYTS